MKLLSRFSLVTLLCLTSFTATSDNILNTSPQNSNSNTSDIAEYLLNLGLFLGYDLETDKPPQPPENYTSTLLNGSSLLVTHQLAFDAFLGAIPISVITKSIAFLPTEISYSNVINGLANMTFTGYGGGDNSQNAIVTASNLIDEPAVKGQFLSDPVSQSVFNILGTPDYTYCMNNDGTTWKKTSDCKVMYQNKVMLNILGYIPAIDEFYTYTYNASLINQLNTNSLLAPLMYSTEQIPELTPPNENGEPGLVAQNQAQLANNFVRYVSGLAVPPTLPSFKAYSDLYTAAVIQDADLDPPSAKQMQAQATLSNYFNSLRVYAAQSSVGFSNLYYILSKRMPQNLGNEPTSQALIEFNMATNRLFIPDSNSSGGGSDKATPNTQWSASLDTASSATIQKEIAVLLAEINYQMYLDRQLQERILLTNTILLMQNLKAGQPSADFANQATDTTTTTLPPSGS